MKITLELPDDLYRQVKAIAVLRGQTVKEWLTNLLRRELSALEAGQSPSDDSAQEAEAFVGELKRLTSLVTARWQGLQDSVEAIREQRCDLAA